MGANFDALWHSYLNGPDGNDMQQESLIKECLNASETLDQAIQVFSTTSMRGKYSWGIPSLALARMITLAKTYIDAKRVYTFASMKNKYKKLVYPRREKEARAKLESFGTANA